MLCALPAGPKAKDSQSSTAYGENTRGEKRKEKKKKKALSERQRRSGAHMELPERVETILN